MNAVRAASIQRQAARLRGLGQSVSALQTPPSCQSWQTLPPSDPAYQMVLQMVQGAGFGTKLPTPVVNGDYHFTYTPAPGSIPAGSMLASGMSPGLPSGTFYMKVNTVDSVLYASQVKIVVCLVPATSTAVAASSSLTPYIVAGVLGVLLIGGLLLAED